MKEKSLILIRQISIPNRYSMKSVKTIRCVGEEVTIHKKLFMGISFNIPGYLDTLNLSSEKEFKRI